MTFVFFRFEFLSSSEYQTSKGAQKYNRAKENIQRFRPCAFSQGGFPLLRIWSHDRATSPLGMRSLFQRRRFHCHQRSQDRFWKLDSLLHFCDQKNITNQMALFFSRTTRFTEVEIICANVFKRSHGSHDQIHTSGNPPFS